MKWRIVIYRCQMCGELVGVACDEKLRYYDDSDMTEHCMECIATMDDFDEIKEVEIEAETISEAVEKAKREVTSNEI